MRTLTARTGHVPYMTCWNVCWQFRERTLPPYRGENTELPGSDGVQLLIVFQIGFLLLTPEYLLMLEFLPLGTCLMAAGGVLGTSLLTWEHREPPRLFDAFIIGDSRAAVCHGNVKYGLNVGGAAAGSCPMRCAWLLVLHRSAAVRS